MIPSLPRQKIYKLHHFNFIKDVFLGKITSVTTYANNHLQAARILNTKPFLEHLINERIVKKIKIKSKPETSL